MSLFSRWWPRKKAEEVLEPPAAHGCCEVCGDDGSLYLESRCHPNSPTWAVLTGNILTVECALCGKLITRFVVIRTEED